METYKVTMQKIADGTVFIDEMQADGPDIVELFYSVEYPDYYMVNMEFVS